MSALGIKQNGAADKEIYSSLGKILETTDFYLAFFTLEKSTSFEKGPRDVGFTKVQKTLSTSSEPVWLTSLEGTQQAKNLNPIRLDQDNIIVIFEVWTTAFEYTAFLHLDGSGTIIKEAQKLCYPVQAQSVETDGKVIRMFAAGSSDTMEVFELSIN
jgi:hypothetical protein